jgi:hypothetical protein
MSQEHVFIVGCARSGTSLLRLILSQSERICIAPETHYIRRFTSIGRRGSKGSGNLADEQNLERMIDSMYSGRQAAQSSYWRWLQRSVDRQSFRERVRALDGTEQAIFELLMQVYAEKTKGGTAGDLLLGEKTPSHFNHIPTLLEWFPGARIIHTFRDPRAILISELKKMQKKGREGPKRMLRSVPDWMLEPLELPFELVHTTHSWLNAAHWHTYCAERYPENYTLVRFEDLVTEPEQQIRRLCRFLNTPFEPAMVREVRVIGSSYQEQHRGATGFDRGALYRWKASLHPAVGLWFTIVGGEQLKKFGYA